MLGEHVHDMGLEVFTDSKNLHRPSMGSSLDNNPRLRTEVAKIQESLRVGELRKFHHVSGDRMIADCLTKRGSCPDKLLHVLGKGKKREDASLGMKV